MLRRLVLGALVLSIALFFALIAITFWTIDSLEFGTSNARQQSETWLSRRVAEQQCLTQEGLREIAAKRDWTIETHETFHWCIDRTDLTGWMSVTLQPPLPFSNADENRRYFGFDTNGCSAEWTYSANCGD